MQMIEKYVSELKDSGMSAAGAGFCGAVLRESLEIPDIQDAAEFEAELETRLMHFLSMGHDKMRDSVSIK